MEDDKLDKISTSSISTASTDISTEQKNNNKVSIDKLLNKKQQDQRTEKKQTPLEKYLDDYAKTLENKSPEDLEKERNKLEQQKKMSLIASIIFAILALVLLITACILLPLAPALVIAILSAIGAITAVASGIIDYNIIDKKIDRVNVKKSQLYWQKKTPLRGNNKTPSASIRPNNSNTKITTTEKNIANNNSAGKEDAKKHANSINNNILKDQGNTNNKNNNQNIQNKNKSNNISNNISANKNNNINTNTLNQASNTRQANKSIQKIPQLQSVNNNEQSDKQKAEKINLNTLTEILQGTLNLSSHRPKNKQEYEQCKNELKQATTKTKKAILQRQMIKYEIWNQLPQKSQQKYEELIRAGTSPEEILKNRVKLKNNVKKGVTDWQVNLYNKHLENEEKKNQSQLSAINHKEKTIEEKRQAVTTAILGQQQKNGIQLSGVGQQTGNNYNSGAITNENMKTQVKKI